MQPFLFFSMQLDSTPELNRGRLMLVDYDSRVLGRWVATSGLGQYQKIGGWSKQGGGVIPATYQCSPEIDRYQVAVKPLNLSHIKGVEGNGYPIVPFEVKTKEGVTRSDLLIHRDANVPGSLGCIVLPGEEFADFEKQMAKLKVEEVPLWIGYTY